MPNYPSDDNYSDPLVWPDWREMDAPPPTEEDPWLDADGADITAKRRAGEPYVGPTSLLADENDIPLTVETDRIERQRRGWK